MSKPLSFRIAPHSTLLNSAFVTAACTIALTLTAGPALAQSSGLDRVEVAGKPVPPRTDVRATCAGIDSELQQSLARVWRREEQAGEVRVSFKLKGNKIESVSTRGTNHNYEIATRRAVRNLQCSDGRGGEGEQVFAFQVAFIDPNVAEANTRSASLPGYTVAILTD